MSHKWVTHIRPTSQDRISSSEDKQYKESRQQGLETHFLRPTFALRKILLRGSIGNTVHINVNEMKALSVGKQP